MEAQLRRLSNEVNDMLPRLEALKQKHAEALKRNRSLSNNVQDLLSTTTMHRPGTGRDELTLGDAASLQWQRSSETFLLCGAPAGNARERVENSYSQPFAHYCDSGAPDHMHHASVCGLSSMNDLRSLALEGENKLRAFGNTLASYSHGISAVPFLADQAQHLRVAARGELLEGGPALDCVKLEYPYASDNSDRVRRLPFHQHPSAYELQNHYDPEYPSQVDQTAGIANGEPHEELWSPQANLDTLTSKITEAVIREPDGRLQQEGDFMSATHGTGVWSLGDASSTHVFERFTMS